MDPIRAAGQVTANAARRGPAPQPKSNGTNFGAVLDQALVRTGDVKLSAHARARLQAAGRTLDGQAMARLEGAVAKAASKGSREALVLLDDLAMVVSVANRTVITAVDQARARENVFTQIDSAVIT